MPHWKYPRPSASRPKPRPDGSYPLLRVRPGSGLAAQLRGEAELFEHLVAQEAFVLRAFPGNKTRLIMRYQGTGFVTPAAHAIRPDAGRLPRLLRFAVHVLGVDLALRVRLSRL